MLCWLDSDSYLDLRRDRFNRESGCMSLLATLRSTESLCDELSRLHPMQ